MASVPHALVPSPSAALTAELAPPHWVWELLDPCCVERLETVADGLTVHVADAGRFALVCARIHGAVALDPLKLQRLTTVAYDEVARQIESRAARHAVRFWNFLPDIQARVDDTLNRYMVFNAGRFAAYAKWYGSPDSFGSRVATATGIGHDAPDLLVYALASQSPGIHVGNPRQSQPFAYSTRYGPFPPCFARATVVDDGDPFGYLAMIGGTASVRGEESLHHDDIAGQAEETFENLACLLRSASYATGETDPPDDLDRVLRRFRDLRVYFLYPEHEARLRTLMAERLPAVSSVEFLRAQICRPELLLEIEGTARLATSREWHKQVSWP